MQINFLKNKIPWFGKYSGYECLLNYFEQNVKMSVAIANDALINRLIGKLYQMYNGWYFARPAEIMAELLFLTRVKKNAISHILYLDTHIHIVSKLGKGRKSVIGTIHIPIDNWDAQNLPLLAKIDNVILLYKEEINQFSNYIPLDRIHVIKHGIDIDFFKPGNPEKVKKNKVLFVGHYLRNFEMFLKVYQLICDRMTDEIQFHFIIPVNHRKELLLKGLLEERNVFFHENLSDQQLLEHYQDSYVLLMPMENSGANTAIIQAIATGLTVITTDVGGIRSYGGDEVFPVIPNNDYMQMFQLYEKYYCDTLLRNKISKNQRNFAVNYLDWKQITAEHVKLYNSLA